MVKKEKTSKKKEVPKQEKSSFLSKIDRDKILSIAPIAILAVVIIVLGFTTENFLTLNNGINVLEQAAVLALLAMGITPVLITGGIDLSQAANLSIGAVLGALYMRDMGGNPFVAGLIMVVTCTLIGMFNGFAVSTLRIIPFVVTLATQFVAIGAATALTGGVSVTVASNEYIDAVQYRLFRIPVYSLITILLGILFNVIMTRSFIGRWIYAVGTNDRAARVSGVPSRKVVFWSYTFAGIMAGLSAVISAGRLLSASALMAGGTVVLDTIAGAVVGGVSSFGGIGTPLGAALGALLMSLISNAMNMARVSYYLTLVIKGLVIIIFVWLNSRREQ
jgi:ribose transport system permease protein